MSDDHEELKLAFRKLVNEQVAGMSDADLANYIVGSVEMLEASKTEWERRHPVMTGSVPAVGVRH